MDSNRRVHKPSLPDDKTVLGNFVDIPENADILAGNLCVGRVICDKHVKAMVIHSVLQQAWGRYAGVRF